MSHAHTILDIYVNIRGYHEYKTFWDASVGEVSARGNFPNQKTVAVLCSCFTEAMTAKELSFDKPPRGYRYHLGV